MTLLIAGGMIGAFVWGIVNALHSERFLLKKIELTIAEQDGISKKARLPISRDELEKGMELPIGKINLFRLNMAEIERKLLEHPWVKSVSLGKRIPDALEIEVRLRRPIAAYQTGNGDMRYLDEKGVLFSAYDQRQSADLPVIVSSGKTEQNISDAVKFIKNWKKSDLGRIAELSSMQVELAAPHQLNAMALYYLPREDRVKRVEVQFSQMIDTENDAEFQTRSMAHLGAVFNYLISHSVAVDHILMGDDKKIVVKTARGS